MTLVCSQLRGKVREPEAMPDIYSDIELEVSLDIYRIFYTSTNPNSKAR